MTQRDEKEPERADADQRDIGQANHAVGADHPRRPHVRWQNGEFEDNRDGKEGWRSRKADHRFAPGRARPRERIDKAEGADGQRDRRQKLEQKSWRFGRDCNIGPGTECRKEDGGGQGDREASSTPPYGRMSWRLCSVSPPRYS
ncbi:MAG: hypothetical protein K0S56_1756 [Microvirga sp.]|nr:hypothetical protein [Microvirga sp.]